MSTHFTEALNYKTCRLVKQSREYNGNVSKKPVKLANCKDVQMK